MENIITQQLIVTALSLPAADRAAIAEAVQASLDDKVDHGLVESLEMVDAAWRSEIRQRISEADSGGSPSIPWAEAREIISGRASRDLG